MTNGDDNLDGFMKFLKFFGNLNGMLVCISSFFPLANRLFEIIPIESEMNLLFHEKAKEFYFVLTTIFNLFMILDFYNSRNQHKNKKKSKENSRLFMIWAFASLIIYLTVPPVLNSLQALALNLFLHQLIFATSLFLYICVFILFTRAFLQQAVILYFENETRR